MRILTKDGMMKKIMVMKIMMKKINKQSCPFMQISKCRVGGPHVILSNAMSLLDNNNVKF